MAKTFNDLKTEVIDAGLCTRCGSCAGVCKPGCIQMTDLLGKVVPVQADPTCCTACGVCYSGCSGKDVNWTALNRQVFGRQPTNYLLGNFQSAGVGFSTDAEMRRGAGSGGVVSAISTFLLENRLVDGVISLNDDPAQPYHPTPQILTTRAQVLSAAQSKYSISPVNTIFRQLLGKSGVYAYVGLPCQIHSLRKLQAAGYAPAKKIKYVIGLYCGNILHFDSVRSYMKRCGVKDLEQVASVKYRAGEWPGSLEVGLKDGRLFSVKKFYANYLIPFYIMRRCLLCTDLTDEFADISVGDGWAPVYEERGKGWSMVLGRTGLGAGLLQTLQEEKRIELFPVTEDGAVNMHSHGLDLKKRGAFLRMRLRRWQGGAVPEYGYTLAGASAARTAEEVLQTAIFWVCSWPLSRWLVNLVPLKVIGGLFQTARKVWMKNTGAESKNSVATARFTVTEER
jgi:coenzyme F420 hydrogenase subunit beta